MSAAKVSRRAVMSTLPFAALGAAVEAVGKASVTTTWALLVGVSRPRALPARLWLRGPANDVELMTQALLQRGVDPQRIQRLHDLGSGERPLASHVKTAMHELAKAAEPGDTVILHLAGHSVQVPMRPGSAPEPDGLDEVFLLSDTGSWDDAQHALPNSLYDDDIGAWMDSVVDKGCRVIAVFDTCHAASLQRRSTTVQRRRGVVKEELGVPEPPVKPDPSRTATTPAMAISPRLDGRVLAHAARAHESTPEELLPRGAAHARVHGIFSFEVAQALRAGIEDAAALDRWLTAAYRRDKREAPVPMVRGQGSLGLAK